jgi:PAS domain S-box-containing protein
MDTSVAFPEFFTHTKQPLVESPDRLRAVAQSGLMYSDPDPLFDELCLLAAETIGTPIALVTVLDDQRQFFKARIGLGAPETPVEWSFCQHTLASPERVLVVGDALNDERVRHSPLVTGEPHIRAYMGAPVVDREGQVFGTLCVIDHQPRTFTRQQEQRLARLAKLVSALIDLQENARRELKDHKQQAALEVQQLVILLTHSLDLQAYADTDGIYRYVNHALASAYGVEPEQLVGQHMQDITGRAAYDQWICEPFKKALAGQPGKFRRLAQFPTLGHRWMDVDLFPVWDDKAAVKGVVLRGRDVHDTVLAQQTIERRLINQQQFLNVLAHDVREPLRTIQGYVSLAIDEGSSALSEDVLGFLRRAQGGGKRLSVLIDDLLAFLRADGEAIRTEPVNLKNLIESVVEDLGELMREQGAVVAHQIEAVDVMGARVWLRLLLQNLVVNGIKYAQPGVAPVVTIAAQVEGNQVLLTVSDNGMGISAEDRSKLFRPFARLASTAAVTGSGLGLALCQKVAELHGTSIGVDSTPGVGSVFSIVLPVVQATSPQAKQSPL